MRRSFRPAAFGIFAFPILAVGLSVAQIPCPEMPDKITQINRDVRTDVDLGIGSLGKVKAGQLGVRTDVIAKNLFDKYPNTDRVIVVQMMAATYCGMLRDSKTLKEPEKLQLWSEFSDRVFKFENPDYKPPLAKAAQGPKPTSEPLFDFDDRRSLQLLSSYTITPHECQMVAHGEKVEQYKNDYKLGFACFFWDQTGSVLDAPNLQVSKLFDITHGDVPMRLTLPQPYIDYLNANRIIHICFAVLLIPNGIETTQFSTLRQARNLKVHILAIPSKG